MLIEWKPYMQRKPKPWILIISNHSCYTHGKTVFCNTVPVFYTGIHLIYIRAITDLDYGWLEFFSKELPFKSMQLRVICFSKQRRTWISSNK